MYQLTLDMYQSAALGAVVLAVGILLLKRSSLLRRICIPSAVVGGLLFSVVMLFLYKGDILEITFDETLKDITMRVFFCSIGFMASMTMLRRGGRVLAVLFVMMIFLVVMQNTIGVSVASLFGLDPKYGLAMGSISLSGGHGTAAAYGEILVKDYGLIGGDVVAIASATFGLAISSLIGAPLGRRLIEKKGLNSEEGDDIFPLTAEKHIDSTHFLWALILIMVSLGLGTLVNSLFQEMNIVLPQYLGSMIVAVVVRNVADLLGYQTPEKEIDILGWLCLCLFLSMALMSMKLWQLEDLALTMIVTLLIQTLALAVFAYILVFRVTGKNYESAMLSSGVMGFGMGAIPNAVANLQVLMDRFGPSHMAYFIVPVVGGVFLDLMNVGILAVLFNIL